MRRGERFKSVGGRGRSFQPHWAFQRLSARRYEKHHKNLIALVRKLPSERGTRFTVVDLLENYWAGELGSNGQPLTSQSASILIQIVHRVGVLDAKGKSPAGNRVWEINENLLKLRALLERLGGREV